MTKYLFYDTETTGFYHGKKAPDHADQPYLVQIAGALVNESERVLGSFNFVIEPFGFSIPVNVAEIHGITDAIASEYGLPLEFAVDTFRRYLDIADVLVAHNIEFDNNIMGTASVRSKIKLPVRANQFCTMKSATDICKIPSKRGGGYKWPKLIEAYQILVDPKGFEGAHDAMVDVQACVEVFFALKRRGVTGTA